MDLGRRRSLRIGQGDDIVQPELRPDDRASLEDGALAGPEPVEARRKQGLDRLRQRALDEASLQRERKELFEKQRVPLRRLDDASALIGFEDRPPETVEERIGLLGRERVEREAACVRPALEERRPVLE